MSVHVFGGIQSVVDLKSVN